PGAEVSLPVFEHDGERFVPVFTSAQRLGEGAPGARRYLRATGADLAAIWPPGHHLALNPGTGLSVAVREDDVRALGGTSNIPAGAELTVGAPAEEPEALWERLRAWAATMPEVRTAHRALVLVHGGGDDPRLVVALDLDAEADPGRILQAGADALGGEAAFTLLDPSGEDPLSGWMLTHSPALYRRDDA
ncbi:MAG TPA: enhanced serine sensitivity protein SseB C-terminal domain-containing protein, partial [Capillimicrobium sp.]|nr:enhanced serine sensitivity protein SseB C-terminal domain-containing protein [Capillimicrobium sp.]